MDERVFLNADGWQGLTNADRWMANADGWLNLYECRWTAFLQKWGEDVDYFVGESGARLFNLYLKIAGFGRTIGRCWHVIMITTININFVLGNNADKWYDHFSFVMKKCVIYNWAFGRYFESCWRFAIITNNVKPTNKMYLTQGLELSMGFSKKNVAQRVSAFDSQRLTLPAVGGGIWVPCRPKNFFEAELGWKHAVPSSWTFFIHWCWVNLHYESYLEVRFSCLPIYPMCYSLNE